MGDAGRMGADRPNNHKKCKERMKKKYLAPIMQVVPVQTTQMLCTSIESNVFEYGGETTEGFEPR